MGLRISSHAGPPAITKFPNTKSPWPDLYKRKRSPPDGEVMIPNGCLLSEWGGQYNQKCFPTLPVNASSPCFAAPRQLVAEVGGSVRKGYPKTKACDYSDIDGPFYGPGKSFGIQHLRRAGRTGGAHHLVGVGGIGR